MPEPRTSQMVWNRWLCQIAWTSQGGAFYNPGPCPINFTRVIRHNLDAILMTIDADIDRQTCAKPGNGGNLRYESVDIKIILVEHIPDTVRGNPRSSRIQYRPQE